MSKVLPKWPDAERVVMKLLEQVAKTVNVTDELAEDTIQVERVGGDDDGITDYPRMEVGCFSHTRKQSQDMAEQCRQVVLASPRTLVDGVCIDTAETVTPANQQPYENQSVRHVLAQYQFSWRRPWSD